jgi:hypothetical protein
MMEMYETNEKNKKLEIVEQETDWREEGDQLHNNSRSHQEGHRLKERRHLLFLPSPHSFAHNFPTLSAIEEGERG